MLLLLSLESACGGAAFARGRGRRRRINVERFERNSCRVLFHLEQNTLKFILLFAPRYC